MSKAFSTDRSISMYKNQYQRKTQLYPQKIPHDITGVNMGGGGGGKTHKGIYSGSEWKGHSKSCINPHCFLMKAYEMNSSIL